MTLPWFKTIDLVERDAGRTREGWDWLKQQQEARRKEEEERETRKSQQQAWLVEGMIKEGQQRTAVQQLEESGLWAELGTFERRGAIEKQISSGFRWLDEYLKERRSKAALAQAAEWEKEKEGEGKERSKVIGKLLTSGEINYDMTPEEAEPLIQQALYEARAQEALQAEDWEKAKEYRQQADWWLEYLYGEPEAKPGVAEMGKPEKLVRAVGKGAKEIGGGLYRGIFESWSSLVNYIDLLARVGEEKWTPEQAEFMKQMGYYAEGLEGVKIRAKALITSREEGLWPAYRELSTGRKMVGEMIAPAWFALPAGATATGARGGLAGLSARLASTGLKVDKALIPFLQGTRVALWPIAQLEAGLAWLLKLPVKGIGAVMAKVQAKQLVTKIKQAPKEVAEQIAPILEKIKTGESFTADDVARAKSFDTKLGESIEKLVGKEAKPPVTPEVKPTAEVTAPKPVTPEVTVGNWVIRGFGHEITTEEQVFYQSLAEYTQRAFPELRGKFQINVANIGALGGEGVVKVTPFTEQQAKSYIEIALDVNREKLRRLADTYGAKKVADTQEFFHEIGHSLKLDEVAANKFSVKQAEKYLKAIPTAEAVAPVTPEVTLPKTEAPVQLELGLKAEAITEAAARPDGGQAWEVYTKLFDVEDAKTTVKRLYPGGLEERLASLIGKLPAGKGMVRLVNPSLTPRQTIEAQKVQELLAVAADRRIRRSQGIKAVVEDMVRAVIPDADAVKLFQIDEKGIQHAFKAKAGFEKAPNGIVDVLEHPQKFELSEPALKMSGIWNNIRESAIKELERRGIYVNKKFYEEGAGYFPRMVTGGHGEELRFPRVRFDRPRHYATQLEAIDNSITYTKDPIENIGSFIDHFHNLIAYDDLTKAVKLVGRTPKDAIPMTTIIRRGEANKVLRGLTHAQNALRRMKRGERLPEVTVKTIERNAEAFGKRVRNAMELVGEERVTAVNKLLGELKTSIPKARLDALKAKSAYKKALEMARSPRLGQFERGTKHPVFRGRIFPEEVAKVLDEAAETGAGGFMKATQSAAQTLRTTVAALDFSPMFIQGTPTLGRFPAKWAATTLRAFRAMASPSYAHKWLAKAENAAIRIRHPDIVTGGLHEYYAGMTTIRRIPVLGKIYQPFERFFTFWGDAARIEIAKALEPAFIKAGKVNQLGTYVNRMTGVMDTRALGISAIQRAAETSWVFFAPRYTRACMAYIGNVLKGGIVGNEARRTLGQLAAGGMATYLGICKATGQKPYIDPRYPTFMTLKVGDRHIGIGGFYYSLLRFLADVTASVAGVGGNEIQDFTKVSRKDNPFIKFMYNRTSPLTGLVTEALQQKDYLGYPFETPEDWAHWLFVEHMMPIALQEQIPGRREEAPAERKSLLAAEMAGLRTFPVEPFYDLADKYAQQVYGVKWNELYAATKGGTYTISAKQKLLLKRFPDLAKAYEPYHEKQSERWKAEHGMTSDKDIALDAYAQERFNKNFDELTETQKRLVRLLYERANK